jgi:H+-transporting ATPase
MSIMKRKPQGSAKNEWESVGNDDIEQNQPEFQHSFGLTSAEAHELLQLYGKNELPENNIPKWYIFLSLFWEPMPVMIWIAIIIEAILYKWMDMSILLGIQITNASIAFYETTKSGDAVAALKSSLKPLSTVKRDGEWKHLDAALLVPGDLVTLANGSAIPADCRINAGTIELDQAALTGECLPVAKFKGDRCQMGSTVVRGEVEATVEFTGSKTFFGKTASLLQVSGNSLLKCSLTDSRLLL